MNKKYTIYEFDKFSKEIRDMVARSFGAEDIDDIDSYITVNQVKSLIIENSFCLKDDELTADEKGLFKACDDIKAMIIDAGLSKLAAKGIIECGWSDEDNDFIFWKSAENS